MFDDGNICCEPVIDLSDMEGGGDTPVEQNAITTKAVGLYLWYLSHCDRMHNNRYCIMLRR
jgi:hypothetical protein